MVKHTARQAPRAQQAQRTVLKRVERAERALGRGVVKHLFIVTVIASHIEIAVEAGAQCQPTSRERYFVFTPRDARMSHFFRRALEEDDLPMEARGYDRDEPDDVSRILNIFGHLRSRHYTRAFMEFDVEKVFTLSMRELELAQEEEEGAPRALPPDLEAVDDATLGIVDAEEPPERPLTRKQLGVCKEVALGQVYREGPVVVHRRVMDHHHWC